MGPVLNGLMELQSIENRLRAANAKLARCRRNVIIQENQVRSLQNALEAKKEEILLTKVQSDRLELELKTRDQEIAKLRASLNAAKSNKEYAALLTQLNTSKADNSKIENQILELLKALEADDAESKHIQSQITEQLQKLDKIRTESETLSEKYQNEIDQIQAEWNKKAQQIPPEPLQIFKRVAETYDGEAIAFVEKQDIQNTAYTCGGCFMGVTTESVNLLLSRDDVIRCQNCTRILVLGPSEEKG
jgi:predicted  nucleic acid-binding Zn-ribbon protein